MQLAEFLPVPFEIGDSGETAGRGRFWIEGPCSGGFEIEGPWLGGGEFEFLGDAGGGGGREEGEGAVGAPAGELG